MRDKKKKNVHVRGCNCLYGIFLKSFRGLKSSEDMLKFYFAGPKNQPVA